jgi:hypothetical protein
MENSSISEVSPGKPFTDALELSLRTYDIVLRRFGDTNILPFFHVTLSFMYYMSQQKAGLAYLKDKYPWKLTALMLNSILNTFSSYSKIESEEFPRLEKEELPRPLPEDFAQRGLLWTEKYFPADWFNNDKLDDDEKYFEVPSMTDIRKERCLWIGVQLSGVGDCLVYDKTARQFSVAEKYDVEIHSLDISTRAEATASDWKQEHADKDMVLPDAEVANPLSV